MLLYKREKFFRVPREIACFQRCLLVSLASQPGSSPFTALENPTCFTEESEIKLNVKLFIGINDCPIRVNKGELERALASTSLPCGNYAEFPRHSLPLSLSRRYNDCLPTVQPPFLTKNLTASWKTPQQSWMCIYLNNYLINSGKYHV